MTFSNLLSLGMESQYLKSMKKLSILAISILLVSITPQAYSAGIVEGSKCKKLNAITKSGTQSFVCLKSGKTLVLVSKFKKCADVISAGRAPIIKESDPLLYLANAGMDRDKDGIACDQ